MVKVAIFHEGNSKKTHDNELIKLLIEKLDLNINEFKFFGMGSKGNFFKINYKNYKELMLDIELRNVSKVLFVVDADYEENDTIYGGYTNTKQKLEKVIEDLGIKDISDIYIMCEPTFKCGYLESFILSTIPQKQKECIETFLYCSEFKSKENHKAILNQIYKIAYPNAPTRSQALQSALPPAKAHRYKS